MARRILCSLLAIPCRRCGRLAMSTARFLSLLSIALVLSIPSSSRLASTGLWKKPYKYVTEKSFGRCASALCSHLALLDGVRCETSLGCHPCPRRPAALEEVGPTVAERLPKMTAVAATLKRVPLTCSFRVGRVSFAEASRMGRRSSRSQFTVFWINAHIYIYIHRK